MNYVFCKIILLSFIPIKHIKKTFLYKIDYSIKNKMITRLCHNLQDKLNFVFNSYLFRSFKLNDKWINLANSNNTLPNMFRFYKIILN